MNDQLSALVRLHALLAQAGIDYWLFGGWAVDFHVGEVTRAHDDVDVAVWLEDVPRIADLLAREGWRHAPEDGEDGGTGYERDGVRLELTYLARDAGGVFTPFSWGRGGWPAGAFADDVAELGRARARVIARHALAQGKSSQRDDPADAAKDAADLERLSSG